MKSKKILLYLLIVAAIAIDSLIIILDLRNQQKAQLTEIIPEVCNSSNSNNCFDIRKECGNFEIINIDNKLVNLKEAKNRCASLCPTCDLPTIDELTCICNNKSMLGNNYENSYYWSKSNNNDNIAYNAAYNLDFNLCAYRAFADGRNKYYALCIRRY